MPSDPSGVLTPQDREFLRSDGDFYTGEYASQSKYQRQRAIRARIVRSLLDFQTIYSNLDDAQRVRIFDDPEVNGADDVAEFQTGVESLLGWIYLGCREGDLSFQSLLTDGVTRAEEDYQQRHGGTLVDVNVEFDVEVTPHSKGVEEFGQALEEGTVLPARDIYKVPMVNKVPVDPEKVDSVRIMPVRPGQQEREKQHVEFILRNYLDIEADVEIVGVIADALKDTEEPSVAVPPEEYSIGPADEPDL